MAIEDHKQQGGGPPAAPVFAGAARRRFARGGLAGAILTLKSQPGMACSVCNSPSGNASGNLNSHAPKLLVCSGKSVDYWRDNPSRWDHGCPSGTKFNKKFNCMGISPLYNQTMLSILQRPSYDHDKVPLLCIAAYQNALAKLTSFLTAAQVQTIWNEYYSHGSYTPVAGKQWNGAQIAAYLSGTMD
ncbi:hypothetical protein [Janthinobacterium sp.]|uniref:hypothetical protein n=1 Tax=Janthinobacterium sp. TaxID=1871054 RepID=UPI00293D4C46|nr:hypothetical protein [Janthinobacterium sp.]